MPYQFILKFGKQATRLLKNPVKLNHVLDEISEKAAEHEKTLKAVGDDISWLTKLTAAYVKGEYRQVPWKVIVAILAALIYFLNPFDLIPDFLAGIGLVDDIAVLAYVVKTFRDELEKFKIFIADRKPMEKSEAAIDEVPDSLNLSRD